MGIDNVYDEFTLFASCGLVVVADGIHGTISTYCQRIIEWFLYWSLCPLDGSMSPRARFMPIIISHEIWSLWNGFPESALLCLCRHIYIFRLGHSNASCMLPLLRNPALKYPFNISHFCRNAVAFCTRIPPHAALGDTTIRPSLSKGVHVICNLQQCRRACNCMPHHITRKKYQMRLKAHSRVGHAKRTYVAIKNPTSTRRAYLGAQNCATRRCSVSFSTNSKQTLKAYANVINSHTGSGCEHVFVLLHAYALSSCENCAAGSCAQVVT